MPIPFDEPQPKTDRSGRAFSRKIQIGFWLVGAILLMIGLAAYQSIREFDETVDWVAHSQEVLGRLQVVLSDVQDIEIGLRGYVMTAKERFLEPYKKGLVVLSHDRERLSTIIQVNPQDPPEQPRNIEMLNALIDKKLVQLNAMLALRKDVPYQAAQMESYMDESKELMDSIRALIEDMQTLEKVRLIARDRHADQKGKNAVLYFTVGVMMEITILIWIAWQIRREIAERQQAQDALRRTHDELELRVQERTKALVESNERLRELSHRLMNVQETERRRIAHDLHDEIGQSLTAMKLELREADSVLESGPTASLLTDSLKLLDQVIQQVRSLALDLRPSLLDELGLAPALKWYIKRQGERAGWETEYSAHEINNHLPPDVAITCFRIVQEALTNVARYAEATHVQVTLERQGDRLVLTIEDNGKGFNVEKAKTRARTGFSIGLLGMEERARLVGGEITITSSAKTGTRLTACLPLVELNPQLVASEERIS
ncbi:MAG: CHASE3 domain-containing protein [Nitrospirota bacterium]|nr:CHASE3 domain-containing protein [Nitrospirota bacterium]